MGATNGSSATPASSWAGLTGRWVFEARSATYLGSDPDATVVAGIAVSDLDVRGGVIETRVSLADAATGAGRVVLGYDPATGSYVSAGVGGGLYAYVLDQFVPQSGWRPLHAAGSVGNLESGHVYALRVELQGQRVSLAVDGVRVFSSDLPAPLAGGQAGVIAWGSAEVRFVDFGVHAVRPRVFVVMQYGEPFDSLYREVIRPVAEDEGFSALRADDVDAPGVILEDIVDAIVESDVVVAEITPANPNVFYEVGYSHALRKPTILLARRPEEPGYRLPFDVSGYRCIFYDDAIRGKAEVEGKLRRHLANIRSGSVSA